MHSEVHLKSDIENNKGSCARFAHYLMKYNTHFFSHNRTDITEKEAIEMIDKHANRGLCKNDDKWYAPTYSLSEEEAQFLAFKLFGKNYTDYQELNEKEKEIWNETVIELARNFQDVMAENFNRKDLGISSGKDLIYVGVVENERHYHGYDEEVKQGKAKSGERKKGFNTHVHIIQSRKANNEKKSKISPLANERKVRENNLGKKVGFDRGQFKINCDKIFDQVTGYKRKIEETFEYKNEVKKNNIHSKEEIKKRIREEKNDLGIFIERRGKKVYRKNKNYVSKSELNKIKKEISLLDYFFELQDKGILIYEGERNGKYIFREYFKNKATIEIEEDGFWRDIENKEKGKIVEAVMKFEQYSWLDSSLYLRDKLMEKKREQSEEFNKRKKIIEERKVTFKNYIEYYQKNFEISEEVIKEHLVQVKYESPNGNKGYGIGMKNDSGGFELTNGKYTSKVGTQDITSIIYKNENKNVLVFNHIEDYLIYLTKQQVDKTREDVIILNEEKNWEKAKEKIKGGNYEKVIYVTDKQNIENNRKILAEEHFYTIELDKMEYRKKKF